MNIQVEFDASGNDFQLNDSEERLITAVRLRYGSKMTVALSAADLRMFGLEVHPTSSGLS
jgi:hypothetical protein